MPALTPNLPPRRYFGTDGVRGVANTELTPDFALQLGRAAASVLRRHTPDSRLVVVGRDTRRSCDVLEAGLVAGLCSQGVDVVTIGVMPTPGVAFVARQQKALAGVVLSASHNPFADNGIKFFGASGAKLPDEIEHEIEAEIENLPQLARAGGADVGISKNVPELTQSYAHFLALTCTADLRGLRIVLDGANGAASKIAPELLRSLQVHVDTLFCSPDGININDGCGSLHPEEMQQRVLEVGADAGIAFDGDADRVILCDGRGRLFDGDRILCAMGMALKAHGKLIENVVVGTIMSNMGLEHALAKHGIRLIRAKVGDRYVHEEMQKHGATLGGEKSGHILLPALSPTGDGLLTALQVLCLLRESGRTLADWNDEMTEYPQKLVSVRVRERNGWDSVPEIVAAMRDAELQLGDRGRLNVRPSGTEKLIRVMVESPDLVEVETITEQVADAVRRTIGA